MQKNEEKISRMPPPQTSSTESLHTQHQQQITVVNRQLNIPPFTISNDMSNTALSWTKWKKKERKREFRFFGLTDPEVKKDRLIIYGGPQIAVFSLNFSSTC